MSETKKREGQELATLYMQQYLDSYRKEGFSVGNVTDGYHSFNELYEHRYALWVALCRVLNDGPVAVYKSWKHGDGSGFEGYFIMMAVLENGRQLSYHLPAKFWDKCAFALTVDKAPAWDGHTSYDVIERLGEVVMGKHLNDAIKLLSLTREVRDAQKQYFKTRAHYDLIQSKHLEKQLDDLLATMPEDV